LHLANPVCIRIFRIRGCTRCAFEELIYTENHLLLNSPPLQGGVRGRADASRNINKVLPIFAENYLVAFSQLTEKYSK
jgi:hypothetical protein